MTSYNITYTTIFNKNKEIQKQTIFEFSETYLQKKRHRIEKSTYTALLQRHKPLNLFEPFNNTELNNLKKRDFLNYIDWLQTTKKLKASTTNNHIKYLNEILFYYAEINDEPAIKLKQVKEQPTKPSPLNETEINQLNNAKLPRNLIESFDVFMFMVYTGMHYADAMQVRKTQINYKDNRPFIIKNRQKTKIEIIQFLDCKAYEILKKYNYQLPFYINSVINKNLKFISEIAGIRPICCSTGRDTFADYWGNKMATDLNNLAINMGLNSQQELKKYLKIRAQRILNSN